MSSLAERLEDLAEHLSGDEYGNPITAADDVRAAMARIDKAEAENAELRAAVLCLRNLWPAARWEMLGAIRSDNPVIDRVHDEYLAQADTRPEQEGK